MKLASVQSNSSVIRICVRFARDRGPLGPNFIWFKIKVTHLYLFIRKWMKKRGMNTSEKVALKEFSFIQNCFNFWACDEFGWNSILLMLLFLMYSFAFSLYVFLSAIIKLLCLSWIKWNLGQMVHNLMLTVHIFYLLRYLVEQWDVLNGLQDQVTTKPISSRCLLQRPISNHTRTSFLYITIKSFCI